MLIHNIAILILYNLITKLEKKLQYFSYKNTGMCLKVNVYTKLRNEKVK